MKKGIPCCTLNVGCTSFAPIDATTYYMGGIHAITAQTTADRCRVYTPLIGVIRKVLIFMHSSTTTGTNESWTMLLRLNNTTDYTIAAVATNENTRLWANYDLNIPVKIGDYFEIKTTCPTWVTNPDGCRMCGTIVIEG